MFHSEHCWYGDYDLFLSDTDGAPCCGLMDKDGVVLVSVVGKRTKSGYAYVNRVFNSMLKTSTKLFSAS